MEYTS